MVCTVIFMSNLTTVLRFCCVEVNQASISLVVPSYLLGALNPWVGSPRIVGTAGWVEPSDKWMMVRMVTITHLSVAPNHLVRKV